MIAEERASASTELAKPRRPFRVARVASTMSKDEAAREGRIIRLAMDHLGVTAAREFLNTPDPQLGGRPLQLATASRAGADAVERAVLENAASIKMTAEDRPGRHET